MSDTFSLVYGLRWEITPPDAVPTQNPTVSGLWTGTQWQTTESGIINGTAPWHMDYAQLAPRIGLAWKLPRLGFVLRAGAGLFYDATLGATIDALVNATWNGAATASPKLAALQRVTQRVLADKLLMLAADSAAAPEVRASDGRAMADGAGGILILRREEGQVAKVC